MCAADFTVGSVVSAHYGFNLAFDYTCFKHITKTTIGEDRHDIILLKEFELNVTFSEDVFQVPDGKIVIGRKKQQQEEE